MPDLLSTDNVANDLVVQGSGKPARAVKSSKGGASSTGSANKRGGGQAELKYGGALTSALAQALALEPQKKTKDQLAESVLADVIAAITAFPGVKLKKLWPLLKELGAENDGATFRRALVRALKEEAERQPVIALSLQTRAPRIDEATRKSAKPDAAAAKQPVEPAATSGTPTIEQELRGLRAPGF